MSNLMSNLTYPWYPLAVKLRANTTKHRKPLPATITEVYVRTQQMCGFEM